VNLPITFAACVLVGGGLGYLLDRWWHTEPYLMLVLGVAGFGVGVREVIVGLQKEEAREKKNDGGW
jgi:ATP synthase protein I